eukprot:1137260-Pelagomonas_calceolata.AAC.2
MIPSFWRDSWATELLWSAERPWEAYQKDMRDWRLNIHRIAIAQASTQPLASPPPPSLLRLQTTSTAALQARRMTVHTLLALKKQVTHIVCVCTHCARTPTHLLRCGVPSSSSSPKSEAMRMAAWSGLPPPLPPPLPPTLP